ncbi:MAG: hypothetical protein ACR2JD_03695 [Nocardioides sp.]
MSKLDAQRAMREAKFARSQERPGTPAARVNRPLVAPVAPDAPEEPAPVTDGLCGHRSMNGRVCSRESGHAAKSHRYA